ncbi:MAG TPA: c-type cytochrome biogenesis protein CcsB, partial [Streptosporangiaceae bacterium]|nr:c-type cytochrome biogenesis protein CcsB [Streptosporangiaceae bacterium]
GPAGGGPAGGPAVVTAGRKGVGRWVAAAVALVCLGLTAHITGVVLRGVSVHRLPWGDMYEFVTALTCVAVAFFLAAMIRYRAYYLGLFVMVAVVLVLGLAETVIYTPAGPLVPALQSYWLAIHVTAMTLATGVFFVAAVAGITYLFVDRHARRVAAGRPAGSDGILRRLPGPEALDRLAYRTVVFGFPIWTFGVMAGAIWADRAWGSYWSWDPTETWAFITWVVYACFLHARATAGWRGRRATVIQLLGFGCLIFNVLVISLVVPGLHSYAGLT